VTEFEIDGKQYRTLKKLDAFVQLHVARKLAPLIVSLTPSPEMRQRLAAESQVDMTELMLPVIEGLSEMKTEDVDYVTSKCLSVVQRNQGAVWANVWNEPAKRMAFEDIDGMALFQITFQVLQENLANFMRAPLSASPQPSPTTGVSQENTSGFQMARTG
jgi:hypothetical protein